MKKLVVLTGAGMSAESGLKTFRDSDGLWEGHDVMQVATPQGFEANPELVLEFYNQRRRQLKETKPNEAHLYVASLETDFEVEIITQNVDDLHERAGSKNITHLHGELLKVRSCYNDTDVIEWHDDLSINDRCDSGYQLRPHVVWFGEAVPMMNVAIEKCSQADILIIIGTSMQVYPAASLMHYIPEGTPVFYIDPRPARIESEQLTIIPKSATEGIEDLKEKLENFK